MAAWPQAALRLTAPVVVGGADTTDEALDAAAVREGALTSDLVERVRSLLDEIEQAGAAPAAACDAIQETAGQFRAAVAGASAPALPAGPAAGPPQQDENQTDQQSFRKMLNKAQSTAKAPGQGVAPSIEVEFKRAVGSLRELAERLSDFGGIPVRCQPLEEAAGREFRRPAPSEWTAAAGGDARLWVLKLRVPPRATMRNVTSVSLQVRVETGILTCKGVHKNFAEYLDNWIAAFGPVAHVMCPDAPKVTYGLQEFLAKRTAA